LDGRVDLAIALVVGVLIGYLGAQALVPKPPEGLYPEGDIVYVPLVAPPYSIDEGVRGFLTYNPNPLDDYTAEVRIWNAKPDHDYEIVLVAHDALGNQENREPVTPVRSDAKGAINARVSTVGMAPGEGGMLDRMYQVHIFLVDPGAPAKENPVGLRNVVVQCKFPMGTGRMLKPEEEAAGWM